MSINKKGMLLALLALAASVMTVFAQDSTDQVKYRRSSLHTMLVDDEGLINGPVIKDAFLSSLVPDKYNDHTVGAKSFNPKDYPVTDADREMAKPKESAAKSLFKGLGKAVAHDVTGGLVDTTGMKDMPIVIGKYLKENHVARDMVAKWFNRNEAGVFNMDLVSERGFYNASEMEADIAQQSARGMATLADMGEELIGNTFVVVSRFNYVSKAEIASAAKSTMGTVTSLIGKKAELIGKAAGAAMDVAAKGYVVKTTSFLYRLVWNEEVSTKFYNEFWMDSLHLDPAKKAAFDTTSLFRFDFVGSETAWADVQSTIFTKKSEEELIQVATVRAVDAVIAKLQKKYEVFKTKTPLYTVEPFSAKIGMKEGVEPGDKFEVLEQVLDEATHRTQYVKKGTLVVDKQVWDNRYMAGEMPDPKVQADTTAPQIDRTLFKGNNKKFYKGMLLRQVK